MLCGLRAVDVKVGIADIGAADKVGASRLVARSSTDGPRRLANVGGGVAIDESGFAACGVSAVDAFGGAVGF